MNSHHKEKHNLSVIKKESIKTVALHQVGKGKRRPHLNLPKFTLLFYSFNTSLSLLVVSTQQDFPF